MVREFVCLDRPDVVLTWYGCDSKGWKCNVPFIDNDKVKTKLVQMSEAELKDEVMSGRWVFVRDV